MQRLPRRHWQRWRTSGAGMPWACGAKAGCPRESCGPAPAAGCSSAASGTWPPAAQPLKLRCKPNFTGSAEPMPNEAMPEALLPSQSSVNNPFTWTEGRKLGEEIRTWRAFWPGRPGGMDGRGKGGMVKGGALKGAGSCGGAPAFAVSCAAAAGSGTAQLRAAGASCGCNAGPAGGASCS